MQEPSESSLPPPRAGDTIHVRETNILKAPLITRDNAKDFYFPDSPFD